MSLRLWRKVRSTPHSSGLSYRRQQPWLNLKLTRQQRRKFTGNKMQYSGLLARSIAKKRLLQVLNANVPIMDSGNTFKKVQVGTFGTNYGASSKPRVIFALPTMRTQQSKMLWFFKTPSAIPGLVKVDRLRSIHRRQQRNLHRLSIWLAHVQTNWLLRVYQLCQSIRTTNSMWCWLQRLEAYFPLLITKMGMNANVPAALQTIQHAKLQRNGQTVNKIWSSANPADVLSLQSHCEWDYYIMTHLASKHSSMAFAKWSNVQKIKQLAIKVRKINKFRKSFKYIKKNVLNLWIQYLIFLFLGYCQVVRH